MLTRISILPRMGEAEGWTYLDALDKNIAEYTKSGSKPGKDAAVGERAIGVSFEYVAREMRKKGSPVETVLPKDISKVVYPNDFGWSVKKRDRILAEGQTRYAK